MKKIVLDPPHHFDLPDGKTLTHAICENLVPPTTQKQPLFQVCAGIPCQEARDQASELLGCVRDLTLTAVMDNDPQLIWAAHYLSALAKALLDDAELGTTR